MDCGLCSIILAVIVVHYLFKPLPRGYESPPEPEPYYPWLDPQYTSKLPDTDWDSDEETPGIVTAQCKRNF